jgi:hypothetical protein
MSKDRLVPPSCSSHALALEARSRSATLPASYTVRRATAADAVHIANLMRPDDRAEMEALEGCSVLDVLRGWMTAPMINPMAQPTAETRRTPVPRLLTIDGAPVVIYGIVASAGWAGHATPWLAAVSTMSHDEVTTVMWLSRLQVDAWQRRWPVLQAVCDVRNHFHGQWLEWLDFVPQGRVEAFGAAGLPFELYRRARAVVSP